MSRQQVDSLCKAVMMHVGWYEARGQPSSKSLLHVFFDLVNLGKQSPPQSILKCYYT